MVCTLKECLLLGFRRRIGGGGECGDVRRVLRRVFRHATPTALPELMPRASETRLAKEHWVNEGWIMYTGEGGRLKLVQAMWCCHRTSSTYACQRRCGVARAHCVARPLAGRRARLLAMSSTCAAARGATRRSACWLRPRCPTLASTGTCWTAPTSSQLSTRMLAVSVFPLFP